MKIEYVSKKFRGASWSTIEQAHDIMVDYHRQGYDLTLRQLYYQFVARGLIENTEKSYKNLGGVISDARLAGLLDWDIMVDRTRKVRSVPHWRGPGEIVQACSQQYRLNTREDQPFYIEVWVEKEALAGIVEAACRDLDVNCLVCRGFVSQSAMWEASMRFREQVDRTSYLIHLGDHDPSGIDMTRDICDRLNDTFRADVQVKRIALTMDQVTLYEPPPNPAKVTDSRYASYQSEYGDESWELDALEPSVLTNLIFDEVNGLTDMDKWDRKRKEQNEHRRTLSKLARELEGK